MDYRSQAEEAVQKSSTIRSYNFPKIAHRYLVKVIEETLDMIYSTPEEQRDEDWQHMMHNAVKQYVRHCCKLIQQGIDEASEESRQSIQDRHYNPVTGRIELELTDGTFVPLQGEDPVQTAAGQQRLKEICRHALDTTLDTPYGELEGDASQNQEQT